MAGKDAAEIEQQLLTQDTREALTNCLPGSELLRSLLRYRHWQYTRYPRYRIGGNTIRFLNLTIAAVTGNNMMVITGPSGCVGQELVKLLNTGNAPCRLACRHRDSAFPFPLQSDIERVHFDFADADTWPATLQDIDTLFLLFPKPRPDYVRSQVTPFVHAAVAAGCRHIVYLSVHAAPTHRGIPHHAVERLLMDCPVNYTILRAGYFSQNFNRTGPTHDVDIRDRDEIFIPLRNAKLQFVDTRDIATVALNALKDRRAHANKAYDLVNEAFDLHQVATIFSEVLQRPIRYRSPSLRQFWWRLWRRGMAVDYLLAMGFVYRLMYSDSLTYPAATLRHLLGREPRSLRQYVVDYCSHWQKMQPGDNQLPTRAPS